MVQIIKLDIHASERDVLTATLPKLQGHEARTGAEKVERLTQQYRGRGLAVAGPQETLEALAKGQVEELLISGGLEISPARVVTKAKQTGATVTFIEDGALLESIGGVGRFLRWRE